MTILLSDSTSITNEYYTVFGKINSEALEDLQDLSEAVLEDEENDIKLRYIGDRDEETDELKVENGKYLGGIEFYLNAGESALKDLDKKEILEKIDELENELYKKLSTASEFDLFALPTKQIKVGNFKLK